MYKHALQELQGQWLKEESKARNGYKPYWTQKKERGIIYEVELVRGEGFMNV